MKDEAKTKKELIAELQELRRRAADEASDAIELAALRESQEKFAKAFLENATPMAITTVAEGRYLDVSEAFLRLMGLTRKEIIGKTSTEIGFLSGEQRSAFIDELNRKGRVDNFELPIAVKGGELKFGLFNSSKILLGGEDYLLTVVADITELKSAEEELRRKSDEVEGFFSLSLDLLCVASIDGYFIRLNPEWEKTLGYKLEELEGRRFLDFIHPDDLPETLAAVSDLAGGKQVLNFTNRYLAKDGTYRWIEWRSAPYQDRLIYAAARDITAHKLAEESLKKSEEKLRLITENMSDMIRVTDLKGDILYVSPSHFKGLGYTLEDRAGKSAFDVVHPDDLEMIISTFADGLSRGGPIKLEYRVRHADGHYLWLETVADLLKDAEGKPTAVVMSSRDVSERKVAVLELGRSEEKYRTLIETTRTGFVIVDTDGRVVDANPEYVRLTGHRELGEIVGRSVIEWTADYEKEKNAAAVGECSKTGYIRNLEIDYVDLKGAITPIEINATCMETKGTVQILTLCRDITDRRRAEEALRYRESYLSAIIENQPGLVWLKDRESRFLAVNKAFAVSCRKEKAEELMGKTDLDIWPRELAEQYRRDDFMILETGNPVTVEEPIYDRGETRWFETFKTPVLDGQGKIIGTTGYARDITERKEIERKLHESERLFRSIVETSYTGIYTSDPGFQFSYVNDKLCEVSGFSREELLGMDLRRLIAPESLPLVEERYVRRQRGEDVPSWYEFTGVRKDGQKRLFETSAVAVTDSSGQVMSIGQILEITDRKRAEQALQESEELFRLLAENARDAIWMMDMNLRYTYLSPYVEQIVGYTPAECMAMPWDKAMTEASLEICLKALAEEMEIEKRDDKDLLRSRMIELEQIGKHGDSVWTEVNMTFIRNAAGVATGILGITRDITQRKAAEEALKASEIRYQSIFENTGTVMLIVEEDMTISFANAEFGKLTGYSREEVEGRKKWTEFVEAAHLDRMIAQHRLRRLNESAAARNYDFVLIRRDGELRDVYLTICVISGTKKSVASLLDITERTRAEAALKQSEQRYRLIAENTADLISILDMNLRFTYMSPASTHLRGFTPEEAMGQTLDEVLTPASMQRCLAIMAEEMELEASGDANPNRIRMLELEEYTKDGSPIWVEVSASILRDAEGKATEILVVSRDITARKRAEEAIRASEERHRTILQTAMDGFARMDMQGRLLEVNETYCRMLGYSEEEMLALNMTDIEAVETASESAAHIQRLMLVGHDRFETRQRRKDGSLINVEVSVQNDPSQGRNFVVFLRDITGRKQAEEERNSLQERLQRAEKMEALGTLAGGIAHDLNNVLGVLVGYSELLVDKLGEGGPLAKYAGSVLQSGLKAAAIIQDLLTMARRGVTVAEVVDLNAVVSAYLQEPEFAKLISYHPGTALKTELEKGLLNIKGSQVHLSKTVMNLVANAAEAVPDQGEVTIRTENRYLDKPVRGYDEMQEGDYVVLTVSDTGKGIAARDIGKIFEPFYTKKVMGRSGTGLGLAVVWGTVKDHGGYIDVVSEEGAGTTFTLYFPATREESTRAEEKAPPSAYLGRGESILVVDDIKEQRELATAMLGGLGYRVEAVASGEAAVDYLREKKADLVVLDMIMDPEIDGLETYRRILEGSPKQKAIIVSGFSETDRVKKAQQIGAGSFVRKPYILEKIGIAVRNELDRK